jgi:hypothetical protein
MIGVILNLTAYVSGLLILVAANFMAVMNHNFADSAAVITMQIVSPLILWAQFLAYNYLFEGLELLSSGLLDYLKSLRSGRTLGGGRRPVGTHGFAFLVGIMRHAESKRRGKC